MAEGRERLEVKAGNQFVKFLVVGAVNTLFGYGVFAVLVLSGIAPMPALVATYVVGVLFNFFTTRKFVFQHTGYASFPRFVGAYAVIFFFNAGLFKAMAAAEAGPLLSQALCLPVVAVFSFFLFKLHVFRDTGPGASANGKSRG